MDLGTSLSVFSLLVSLTVIAVTIKRSFAQANKDFPLPPKQKKAKK